MENSTTPGFDSSSRPSVFYDDVVNGNRTVVTSSTDLLKPYLFVFTPVDHVKMFQMVSRTLTASLALCGFVINFFVFQATRRISPKSLQSKHLIQNAILADMLFDTGPVLIAMSYALQAFKVPFDIVKVIRFESNHLYAGFLCLQVFSSAALACDRFYAVVKPMTYHTVGYNKIATIVVVTIPWMAAITVTLTGMFIMIADERLKGKPFSAILAVGFAEMGMTTKYIIAIGVNTFIFALYLLIFVVFILQRRLNKAVGKSTSEGRKNTLSLTITYFCTHLSTLGLYLPGPLFGLLLDHFPTDVLSRNAWSVANQFMAMLYVSNTVINPFILSSRVRLIGENLSRLIKIRRVQKTPEPLTAETSTNSKHGSYSSKRA